MLQGGLRGTRWLLLVGLWACSGPDDGEICGNEADDDGDGFVDCADQDCVGDAACVEGDCTDGVDDDVDGLVDCDDPDCADACEPTACEGDCVEDCTNGIDDDRDFLVDCADDDCSSVCDADGDGYDGLGGPDCDDTRPDVNPLAEEVPYDGADNDCDPLTPDDDLDGDGFLAASDCNDQLAASYPGAPETCGNGVVDDCDASGDPGVAACFGERLFSTADVRITSTTQEGWLGSSVALLGDVDEDGAPELVLGMYGESGATGAVWVVSVPDEVGPVDVATARAKITGVSEQDWVGEAVTVMPKASRPDENNLVCGARYDDAADNNAGATYVIDASFEGTRSVETAVSVVQGERAGDNLGASLARGGDIDGDGVVDLVMGAPLRDAGDYGAAYVFFGPVPAGATIADGADVALYTDGQGSQFGGAVAAGRDTDGDGLADVAVGARFGRPDGLEGAGLAYLYTGLTAPGAIPDSLATAVLYGDEEQALLGVAVALGDMNGDGLADLIAGAPGANAGGGKVMVGAGGQTGLLTAGITLDGSGSDAFGSSLAVGDIDGDGVEDLVVGAPGADTAGGEDAGAVYIFFGPVSSGQAPDVAILGDAPFGFVGHAVHVGADWTGDGRSELIVGAPFVDGGASASGEVGVFMWGY